MSSPAQCTIFGLEHKFTEPPSSKNSVQTIGGEIVRMDKAIWIASPVLKNHLEHGNSYKMLNASKNCVEALCEAHKYGTFPSDFKSSLNLLALSSELELRSLTTKCFGALQKTEAFYELDYPAECSIETVMRCFRVFLDSPLRTEDIYEQQLNRIARHCSNDPHVMSNAINLVKQMLEKYINRSLEGIPVGFDRRMVPVVILERNGKRQTAIIDGSELRLLNVFGEHFHPDAVEVDDSFYLKYGSYLLYQSGEFVYYKDLRDDSEPIEKLNRCTISITRATFVFAVRNEGDCYSISLWTNDEQFVMIYQFTKAITMLEFDSDKRVLAVILEKTKLLFFRLEGDTLFLLHQDCVPELGSILLSGEDKFYLVKTENGLTFETYRVAILNGDASDQSVEAKADDGNTSETWESSREGYYMDFFCGDHYFFENRCLEILQNFPSRHPARPLLAEGELCSISELWLLP